MGAPVAPQGADTRQLIKFQNFQEINANFVEQTAATTAAMTTTANQVIVGTANIQQNLVTDFLNGNEAQYKINVRTTGTLDLTGQNIMIGLTTGCTTGFNIDGMNGMTTLRGLHMQILDSTGTMI